MKKSFVLLLALVVLVTGIGYYAQTELLKEKDQVHYTERALYGDKSVVEGVTVEADPRYGYFLYWNTKYQIGNEPKEETEYTMYPWEVQLDRYYYPGSLSFAMDSEIQLQIGITNYEKDTYYGLEKAIKELYDKTSPGTENMVTVKLKDYLDYYNFSMDLELPDSVGRGIFGHYGYAQESELREDLARWEETGSNKEEAKRVRKYLDALDVFQEFFKIPVLDTEVYTIGMAKDEAGRVIGMSESSAHGGSSTGQINIPDAPQMEGMDNFTLATYSVFDNGDCYFTFDPHTFNENVVDVSQIPGGYGIYHFTYDKNAEINLDNLEMVYPMDVNVHFVDMCVDASGENILLFTSDEENHYMSIIDRESMTLVDTFSIGNREFYLSNWVYDDFLVTSTDMLMVFPLGEDGRYTQAFAVNQQDIKDTMLEITDSQYFLRYGSSLDWNGEQLLIANDVRYEVEYSSLATSNFYVAVVDKNGLVYYGEYDSSLETNNENYDGCHFGSNYENPIRVYWSK